MSLANLVEGRLRSIRMLTVPLLALCLMVGFGLSPCGAVAPKSVVHGPRLTSISAIAISPNGQILASNCTTGVPDSQSGSCYYQIRLWDLHTGKLLRSLCGHSGPISDVAFSSDGRTLASSSGDRTVKLWDVASGQELRTLVGHTTGVSSVAFSPDDTKVVSGAGDNIRLWNASSGTLLGSKVCKQSAPDAKMFSAFSVAFSPGNHSFACGAQDATTRIFDEQLRQTALFQNNYEIEVTTYSPDGKELVSGSEVGEILIYNVASHRLIRKMQSASRVYGLAFSRDGKTLAASGLEKTLELWDPQTGRRLKKLVGHTDDVYTIAFTPDGKTLVSGSEDGTFKLWDVASGKLLRTILSVAPSAPSSGIILAHGGKTKPPVYCVVFSPDGRLVASAAGQDPNTGHATPGTSVVKIWDATTKAELRTLDLQKDKVTTVAFSPDGQKIAAAAFDNVVKVWDVSSGKLLLQVSPHFGGGAKVVAFSADGNGLLIGGYGNPVSLWNLASGEKVRDISAQGEWFNGGLSHDGLMLADNDGLQHVRLWEVGSSNHQMMSFGYDNPDGFNPVKSLAFNPSDKLIAIGNGDGTANIFDIASGKRLHKLIGSSWSLLSLAFSPSGTMLACGSQGTTITLWDVASGKMLRVFAVLSGQAKSIAFSPDGKTLVSGADDGSVELWPVSQ